VFKTCAVKRSIKQGQVLNGLQAVPHIVSASWAANSFCESFSVCNLYNLWRTTKPATT